MMKWTGLGALACAAAFAVACNNTTRDARVVDDADRPTTAELKNAETVGTSGQTDRATAHGQEGDARYFVEHAAMAGNAEVELGRLAVQKARSAEVKQFAEMMVRDHTKAGNELKQAVAAHNVETPKALDAEHRQLEGRLSRLDGAEFDREYMKAMVEGHKEMKSMVEGRVDKTHDSRMPKPTGTSGTSPLDMTVNQWAEKARPTVQQHLQKAEEIYAKVR
jgi:putative membrane protein